MNRRNNQEIDNAKSKSDECRFGRGRWDGNGDIDRGCDNYAYFWANDGDPGNGAKDKSALRKMPYGAAGAQ